MYARSMVREAPPRPAVPRGLQLAYTGWFVVWFAVYLVRLGPVHFLWVCDVANFILLVALWRSSALLASSQAVGVLAIQLAWAVDFLARLLFGVHPVGGTEYMFDATEPWYLRSLSLFHLAVPVLLVWLILRLGYDRRGVWLQSAITWVVLPATFLLAPAEDNLNWLWEPFGIPQTWMAPEWFLLVAMVAYPLGVYLPTHLVLAAWARRSGRVVLRPRPPRGP